MVLCLAVRMVHCLVESRALKTEHLWDSWKAYRLVLYLVGMLAVGRTGTKAKQMVDYLESKKGS